MTLEEYIGELERLFALFVAEKIDLPTLVSVVNERVNEQRAAADRASSPLDAEAMGAALGAAVALQSISKKLGALEPFGEEHARLSVTEALLVTREQEMA